MSGSMRAWPGDPPAQIITALVSLGLDPFPFSAFDVAGRLVSPPSVPNDLRRELEEVLKQPDWDRVFKAVSLFDNPGHQAYALGFALDGKGGNLIAVRSTDTISRPEQAQQWYLSLGDTILARVQAEAGKRYLVKPSWIEAIRKILSLIGAQIEERSRLDLSQPENQSELSALIDVRIAIEFILGVLEVANVFGRRHSISCIVLWQYSSWKPALDREKARVWWPIGSVVNNGGRNVAGALWDERNRTLWHWSDTSKWYGIRISPHVLYRAWYPSGELISAGLPAGAKLLAGDPEAGPAPAPPNGQ